MLSNSKVVSVRSAETRRQSIDKTISCSAMTFVRIKIILKPPDNISKTSLEIAYKVYEAFDVIYKD